jgi:phosphoglycolate phosphatase
MFGCFTVSPTILPAAWRTALLPNRQRLVEPARQTDDHSPRLDDRPVSAVLFDLDGTLVDSLHGIHATACAVLTERGHSPCDVTTLRTLVGAPLELIFGTLLPSLGPEECLAYAEHYRALYWTVGIPHTPLFPGIRDVLDTLREADPRLAVVTTKREDVAGRVLEACDLSAHFSAVVGGDTTPHHKPHPAPALAALERLRCEAARTAVVGDTSFDVQMARAAGCRPIAVGWGYGSRDSLLACGAEVVAETPAQLLDLLLPDRS